VYAVYSATRIPTILLFDEVTMLHFGLHGRLKRLEALMASCLFKICSVEVSRRSISLPAFKIQQTSGQATRRTIPQFREY
jgi:hypothetical protein